MSGIDLENGKNGFAPVIRLNSGYDLPALGLGTYALHGNTCINAVISAIKSGYRLIDTASFYGNEREVGEGIRKSGVAREKIFVQTKLYPNQYSQAAKAIDEALKKLNIDYIDMMLLHHPASNDAAAYQAIKKAIQNGKVRTAGISCYYIQETDFFLPKVSVKPALIQNEIHPYYQDSSVVEHIQNKGIIVQSWYPLGGRGYTKALLNDPVLQKIAAAHRKSVAQVILRWNLQKGVCVIPGSSTTEHIRENISIFDFALIAIIISLPIFNFSDKPGSTRCSCRRSQYGREFPRRPGKVRRRVHRPVKTAYCGSPVPLPPDIPPAWFCSFRQKMPAALE